MNFFYPDVPFYLSRLMLDSQWCFSRIFMESCFSYRVSLVLPLSQSVLFLFLPIYLVGFNITVPQALNLSWFLATFLHLSLSFFFYCSVTLTVPYISSSSAVNSNCVMPSQKFCNQMILGKRTFASNVLCCVLENSAWILKKSTNFLPQNCAVMILGKADMKASIQIQSILNWRWKP